MQTPVKQLMTGSPLSVEAETSALAALDLMVDKEVLVEGALWGQGVVTASPSFPASPTYNTELKVRSHINERAKAADGDPRFSVRIRAGLPRMSEGPEA